MQPCSRPLHRNSWFPHFFWEHHNNKLDKAQFITRIQTSSHLLQVYFERSHLSLSVSIQPCFILTLRLISGSNISDVSMLNGATPLLSVVKLSTFLLLTNSWITSLEIGELSLSTSLICKRERETCSANYLSVCRYCFALLCSPHSRICFSSQFKAIIKNQNACLHFLAAVSAVLWGLEQELHQHLLHHW